MTNGREETGGSILIGGLMLPLPTSVAIKIMWSKYGLDN